MNYFKFDIVFQEIPDEMALAIYFTGCPLKCKGCHSPELWNKKNGQLFTTKVLDKLIKKYEGSISCVLCMGGEWEPATLSKILKKIKSYNLKAALYTGREITDLPNEILEQLDFLKTGPWKEQLGGLGSKTTNQKFFIMKTQTEGKCFHNTG